MDTNEVMMNEDVIELFPAEETAEVVRTTGSGTMKRVACVGLTVLGGVILYKYVGKPLVAKAKEKWNERKTAAIAKEEAGKSGCVYAEAYEVSDEDDEK